MGNRRNPRTRASASPWHWKGHTSLGLTMALKGSGINHVWYVTWLAELFRLVSGRVKTSASTCRPVVCVLHFFHQQYSPLMRGTWYWPSFTSWHVLKSMCWERCCFWTGPSLRRRWSCVADAVPPSPHSWIFVECSHPRTHPGIDSTTSWQILTSVSSSSPHQYREQQQQQQQHHQQQMHQQQLQQQQ